MSTNLKGGGAVKSKKAASAAKVSGESTGIAGVLLVGGVVAFGIAAGLIAGLRKRQNCKEKTPPPQQQRVNDDDFSGRMAEKSGQNPGEIYPETKLNETCAEISEEIEPIIEIVESFDTTDFFANGKAINRSKGEDSPRSHFSLTGSIGTNTTISQSSWESSDSDELSEIIQSNYRGHFETESRQSHQMNLKQDDFCSTPVEETDDKGTPHFIELVPDKECISVKEPKLEYEESVDSFDGLEECEKVGKFEEVGFPGEQKIADFEGWEGFVGKESAQCDLDCTEKYNADEGIDFGNGDKKPGSFGLEKDGSLCVEQCHERSDAEKSEDSQREEVSYKETSDKETFSLQVSGSVKEDLYLEEVDQHKRASSEQNIALVKEECLQEKIGPSEGLNCDEEECLQEVIDSKDSRDYKVGAASCDEKGQRGELEKSSELLCPVREEWQQETVQSNELECTVEGHGHQDGDQHEIVVANREMLLCNEQCLKEEKFESNAEQCSQEKTDSGESEGCKADIAHKSESCQYGRVDSRGLEGLGGKGVDSNCDEKGQHVELEDSEKIFCPIREEFLQETLQYKELECTEINVNVHQDGHQNEIVGAHEEVLLCKEQCPQAQKFEYNVEQCPQERTESAEELEDCKVDAAHKSEQCQHGTIDSRDLEGLDFKGCVNHCDENGQHGELEDSEQSFSPIKEECQQGTVQYKELECTIVDVHLHQDEQQNEIVGANKEVILCKEEYTQEKFETNAEKRLQERTDSEDSDDSKVEVAHKGETCHYGTVDSRHVEVLDYKGSDNDCDGKGRHGVLEDLKENVCLIKEECQKETAQSKGSEYTEVDVQVYQDEHQREINGANQEVILFKQKFLQEENVESNAEQCPQKGVDSEDGPENGMLDTIHKEEECQCVTVDSRDFESLDYKGGVSHFDAKGQHGELENSQEIFCPIKELCQKETVQFKELECTEVDVHVYQDGHQNEMIGACQGVLPCKEQCLQEENFESNVDQCPQEESADYKIGVVHEGDKQYGAVDSRNFVGLDEGGLHGNGSGQYETVDSKDFEGLDENASRENGVCQYGTVDCEDFDALLSGQYGAADSKDFEGLDGNASHENGSCQYETVDCEDFVTLDEGASHANGTYQFGTVDPRELEDSKGGVHFEKEQIDKERVNSKEDVDLNIGSEEKLPPQEENIQESPEAIGKASIMNVQFEESTVDLKEIEHLEGNAFIVKQQCQEELVDSGESQNHVQDAVFKTGGCKEISSEFEELEFIQEDKLITEEQCQHETVDSVDKQDTVKGTPDKNNQCQRDISEFEEIEDMPISGKQCQKDAVDAEHLELSEHAHSSNEPYQEEMVESNLENVKMDIDSKESEYSSTNALLFKDPCPDKTVDHKASEIYTEDPQTYNKSEEVDTEESEYSSGDKVVSIEKHQQEAVDKVAIEDYKQDPEIYHEEEEVHANNSEHLNTHRHFLNSEEEVNQSISTASVSESSELVGVSKGLQANDESSDSKTQPALKSESREVDCANSVTKRANNRGDPLQSEEGKSLLMQPHDRLLPIGIRMVVLVCALLALFFLFASRLAKISTSSTAI